MILSKERITKALISLRGCTGWSAHVLFANPPKTGFLALRPINIKHPQKKYRLGTLFVFAALRPKSTAMVIAGRSVHLTTHFPGQA